MLDTLVFAFRVFGPKEIAVYVIVILALIAVGLYMRRGAVGR